MGVGEPQCAWHVWERLPLRSLRVALLQAACLMSFGLSDVLASDCADLARTVALQGEKGVPALHSESVLRGLFLCYIDRPGFLIAQYFRSELSYTHLVLASSFPLRRFRVLTPNRATVPSCVGGL